MMNKQKTKNIKKKKLLQCPRYHRVNTAREHMPPLSEDKPLTCRQSVLIQATQYPHQVLNPHSSSIYRCFPNTWLSIFTQLSWRQHVEVSCVEIFWVKWQQDKDEMHAVQGQSVLWWWVHISHAESSEYGAQYHIWSVDEHRKTSIMWHTEHGRPLFKNSISPGGLWPRQGKDLFSIIMICNCIRIVFIYQYYW